MKTREIKFRAWLTQKDSGKQIMFYQSAQYLQSFLKRCSFMSSGREHENYGKYELMQFTGLVDVNGKEIYEGDILAFDLSSEIEGESELGIVRFAKGGFWTSQDEDHLEEVLSEELESFPTSIIGNIFEHPEIIK